MELECNRKLASSAACIQTVANKRTAAAVVVKWAHEGEIQIEKKCRLYSDTMLAAKAYHKLWEKSNIRQAQNWAVESNNFACNQNILDLS